MAIGVGEANLIAVLSEAVLFGAFTTLYAIALYTMIPTIGKRVNQIVLAVATGMFALSITHLAIDIQRIVNAFIKYPNKVGGPDAYLNEPSEPLFVAQLSVYIVQTVLGDAFMVYRLYIVWARNKLITAPIVLCFLGSIVAGIGGTHAVSKVSPGDLVYVVKVKHWGATFYSMTLATNFICTVLIALRIWWIGRRTSLIYASRSLSPVLIIIIESGAVYSTTLIAVIVTYTTNDSSHYFFLDAICPIMGLVFTGIIVRIGHGVSTEEASSGSDNPRRRLTSKSIQPISVQMTYAKGSCNNIGDAIELTRNDSPRNEYISKDLEVSMNRDENAATLREIV